MTLTQGDLDALRDLMAVTVDESIEKKRLVTEDMISHLPTKEEFYDESAKLMKELKDLREEVTVSTGTVSRHTDEISEIQTKIGIHTS